MPEGGQREEIEIDAEAELKRYQTLLSLPRETLPQLTSRETRRAIEGSAAASGLEVVEKKGATPLFLLLPPDRRPPRVTIFAVWHAEGLAGPPVSVEGSERLALAAVLCAVTATARAESGREAASIAVVAAPSAGSGSFPLDTAIREERERLRASAGFWIRIAPRAARRRPVFLGSRGRVVLGIWGDEANPYRVRDQIVAELSEAAFGPRPLDFELIRKLASEPGAESEERIRERLFLPRGEVSAPAVKHPDRPRAWIAFETAEDMEAGRIADRARSMAGTARVDVAEAFPWDRLNIHHPSIHALIGIAKSRSEGAEIWPSSHWPSPSGLFTRALGTGLAEWSVPLPEGAFHRRPAAPHFESIVREIVELIRRALALTAR